MTTTVTVTVPEAVVETMREWPGSPTMAIFSRTVMAHHGHVHSAHGRSTPDDAAALATALIAAAWWAGYRPVPNSEGEVIAIPAPITPGWGSPGWLYFPYGDGTVAAHSGDSTVELGSGARLDNAAAWAEGLALLGASRYLYTCGDAVSGTEGDAA